MAEFHWIGSTGNSINKFFWNNINNWAVKTSNGIIRASSFGRLPQGNDTVKIGTDLHCFSPLLYGGYSGGSGPVIGTGATQGAGHWCMGVTAGDISLAGNGYTAGVTGGGVCFIFATDILAASESASVSNALSYGLLNGTVGMYDPNGIWSSSNIASAASNNGMNPDTLFFQMLSNINPHALGIAGSGQAVSPAEASKYPFPYLGGGVTGDIFNYVKSVWGISQKGASGTYLQQIENAWVGGGWTGGPDQIPADATNGLRLRIGGKDSIGTKSAFLVSPGVGAVAQNRILNVDVKTVADKVVGSNQVVTDVSLQSRGNPLHSYVFRTGSFRSVVSKGDAALMMESCTAGSVQVDYHNYTSVGPNTRVGGLVVDTDNNDPRYHPWVLYMAGSVTSGARNAVYGTAANIRVDFPWNNKVLVNTNPLTYSTTSWAKGMSGFTWSTVNPLIGIGEYGGTGAPFTETSGASAGYYTSIPAVEVYSNTMPVSSNLNSSESPASTQYNIELLGNSSLGTVLSHGANMYYSFRGNSDAIVYMGSLRMREGAVLDFTRNPEMDNWFIGGFTGSTSNVQMVGGILVEDDTCLIRPSAGNQMINNKIISNDGIQGVDARASAFLPGNNPAFSNSASYAVAQRQPDSLGSFFGVIPNVPSAGVQD